MYGSSTTPGIDCVALLAPDSAGPGPRGTDSTDDEEPVPAELVELDNALTADVAAAVGLAFSVVGTARAKMAALDSSSAIIAQMHYHVEVVGPLAYSHTQ
jgi:hypothetical protein